MRIFEKAPVLRERSLGFRRNENLSETIWTNAWPKKFQSVVLEDKCVWLAIC